MDQENVTPLHNGVEKNNDILNFAGKWMESEVLREGDIGYTLKVFNMLTGRLNMWAIDGGLGSSINDPGKRKFFTNKWYVGIRSSVILSSNGEMYTSLILQ